MQDWLRRRVVAVELLPNPGSERDLFPSLAVVRLICGHARRVLVMEQEAVGYRPELMACPECARAQVGRQ